MSDLVGNKAKVIATELSELLDMATTDAAWHERYLMCSGLGEETMCEVYALIVTIVTQLGANWEHRFADVFNSGTSTFMLMTLLDKDREVESDARKRLVASWLAMPTRALHYPHYDILWKFLSLFKGDFQIVEDNCGTQSFVGGHCIKENPRRSKGGIIRCRQW